MRTLRELGCAGSTADPDEEADENCQKDQHHGGDHAADAGVGHGFFGRFFGGVGGGHGFGAVWVGCGIGRRMERGKWREINAQPTRRNSRGTVWMFRR